MCGSMSYERENIQRLDPYVPGEQPADTDHVVKLNTNENPYPPPPTVLEAVASITGEQLRRYPPGDAKRFRETAASVHNLLPDQIIATNAGDEVLRLALTTFCKPTGYAFSTSAKNSSTSDNIDSTKENGRASGGKSGGVGMGIPSYSLMEVLAGIHDTPLVSIPLQQDFSWPVDFAQRVIDANCRLAFVVNPHAPSGRLADLDALRQLADELAGHAVLLIDEAYVNFASRDALPLVRDDQRENVLILRTLSKGYSLAGLRFGYAIGHANLIAAMGKAKDSFNTDIIAQAAATAALENRDAAAQSWQAVIAERTKLSDALRSRDWHVWPSESNFILTTPPAPNADAPDNTSPAAATIYESLKQNNVFVRYFKQPRLDQSLRITVGTPAQNQRLLDVLDTLNS